MNTDAVVYRGGRGAAAGEGDPDPITTEIVRQGLNSAAEQMKRALVRTAFSTVIYEVLDFAVAIYDREIRMLAQAPSLPVFMGTLSFCVEGAVAAVGGEDQLEPGDIVLYNYPYGTGAHSQDAAVVMPVYVGDELIAYVAVKAHLLDLGGKDPYCTDSIDVFQEGTIFPGVKLFQRGEAVDDIFRIVLANSRIPGVIAGDLNAEIVALRTGAAAVAHLVGRFGLDRFRLAVERMFDHGEAVVRQYFEAIPDGEYVGHGALDSDGLTDEMIPFAIHVTVRGSAVCVDYSDAPDQLQGPYNCPVPTTVSASRVAVSMLAGGCEAPNEGHFRPIEVVARRGSLFDPEPPAPCFIYGKAGIQAIEVIYRAIAEAMPEAVPACSGGDTCVLIWWGWREATGALWVDGAPHPVGQGAHAEGDGANSLLHVSEAFTRFTPVEVWEAKNPWLVEKVELAANSGGAGRHQGGLGVDMFFHMLEESWVTCSIERTKNNPWGLSGGHEGRPNGAALRNPNGTRVALKKGTRLRVPKGTTFELYTGGGGGYGSPAERNRAAVQTDLQEGYITEAHARRYYPHAVVQKEAERIERPVQ